mgnify:CR=1 FL=1
MSKDKDKDKDKKRYRAVIAQNECVACGCCVKACPKDAIKVYKSITATVDFSKCVGCGKCEKHCPQHIEIRKHLKDAQKELETPLYRVVSKAVKKFAKFSQNFQETPPLPFSTERSVTLSGIPMRVAPIMPKMIEPFTLSLSRSAIKNSPESATTAVFAA